MVGVRHLRWLRRVLIALGATAALLVAAFGLAQTGPGRAAVASLIARLASQPGATVTIGRLDGLLPFDMVVRDLAVADAQGPWLQVDRLRVDWKLLDLLSRRIRLPAVEIDTATLDRLPQAPAHAAAAPADRFALPQLPVTVALDRFAVARLAIGASVAGEPLVLAIDGGATLEPARATATLAIRRIDGPAGMLDLRLAFAPAENRLDLRVDAREPSGWLADRLLARTDRRPLQLSLDGDGPLDGWRGRLTARLGDDAGADLDLTVRGSSPHRLSIDGTLRAAPLVPPDWSAIVADGVRLSAGLAFAGGGVALESLEAATGVVTVAAQGRLDRAGTLSGVVDTTLVDLAPVGAALGLPIAGAATATAALSGTLSAPIADLRLEAQALATAELQAAALTARLTVRLGDTGVAVATDGRLTALRIGGAPPPVGDVGWSAAATIGRDGRVAVERAAVTATDLSADFSGTIDPTGAIAGQLGARIGAGFLAGLGAPLRGTATVSAAVRGDVASSSVDAEMSGELGEAEGEPALLALLGERLRWSATARRDADGTVRVGGLTVEGAHLGLDGNATLASDRSIDARLRLRLPRLDVLSKPLGTPLAGDLAVAASATGPLRQPTVRMRVTSSNVSAGGRRWRALQATVDGGREAAGFTARLAASASAEGVPVTLAARITHDGGTRLALDDVVATAAGARLAGRAEIVDARPVEANAILTVPDLSRLAPLLGEAAAGRIDGEARLAPAGRTARLTLKASARGFAAADLSVGNADLQATIEDPNGRPRGNARMRAGRITAAGQAIDAVTLDLAGDPVAGVRATLSARAPRPKPLTVDVATRLVLDGPAIAATVERADVRIAEQRVALGAPLRLRWSDGTLAADGIDLRLEQARLAGSGRYAAAGATAELTLERLSLAALGRLAGVRGMQGQIEGRLALDTRSARPAATLALQGDGIRWRGTPRDLPALGFTADMRWADGRVAANAALRNVPDATLSVSAEGPLILAARPLGFAVPPEGALAARADGAADLARLGAYVPVESLAMAGRLEAALSVAGTVAAPRPGGRATLTNARIEDGTTGMVLAALGATVVGDGTEFRLDSLAATDGAGGRVSGNGRARRGAAGWQAEATVALERFRVLANDLGRVIASGSIEARSTPAGARVAGTVRIEQGDVTLPAAAPAAVTPVAVVEINRPDGAPTRETAAAPATIPVALDVAVAIPGRLFVRGRGLDSEWRGDLRVAGTLDAPLVSGSIATVRGRYDLLGRRFTVERGIIAFDGDPAAATLDLLATATTNQLRATVTVSGSAAAPTLTLGSDPPLPQDEVLAQVLFGKSTTQMTPGQAVQLAQAASELAGIGGGTGIVDRVRRSLGLDALDVGGDSGTSVTLGKYVADGVFVKVNPNPGENASAVAVEIEVLPNVTVDAGVGGEGTSVGVKYRFDY
ncbi:MAG: translocation/assembly module TamB domain-containing protein [Alphaproteobacteria bacterium]|nr:translocation/assembly module TamB domain-containing protein [Alphaproteobacteria bacterium]